MMSTLIYYAIPAFIITVALEALYVRQRANVRGYETKDTFASLTMGVGNVLIAGVVKIGVIALWLFLYEHRIFDLPVSAWWVWLLLFVCEDFCYYWFHRVSHESRFFWAAHVNHHSSTHYNLSTALRQSWTTPFTGIVFWLPLPLLGFHPGMILVQQAISLLYQYWLHVEWLPKLGPFEWIFNTPSHHRVHHGRNVKYLDRNHGGILIVWDRLFGTFEPEAETPDYGLTKNIETFHPVKIAFHEWLAIARDVMRARSLRDALGYVFGPPGWAPGGRGETSAVLRARLARS
ncbi:Sterol desaturase [Sandaracinus amylolyticus]|uniref:Sterol desaturase n=2 Tax=Sandaracinus amylolyticus TaxID=927083 RepID=A0A0F6YH99_9BACT|nr:Sterol desaturase [Sandaracinus amylolyticus]